jgi:hypothetical protein
MEEVRGVYRVLVGSPKGKRPLGRSRCRCEYNITMDLREIVIDRANWIHLAQDSPMKSFCEHGNEPSGYIKKADKLSNCQVFKEYPVSWSK